MKTRKIVFLVSAAAFLILIVALFLVSALRDLFRHRSEEEQSNPHQHKKAGGRSLAPRLP